MAQGFREVTAQLYPDLDSEALMDIAAMWPGPHARKHNYLQNEVFVEVIPPPPTLLIFGATDIAAPLAVMARISKPRMGTAGSISAA